MRWTFCTDLCRIHPLVHPKGGYLQLKAKGQRPPQQLSRNELSFKPALIVVDAVYSTLVLLPQLDKMLSRLANLTTSIPATLSPPAECSKSIGCGGRCIINRYTIHPAQQNVAKA